jgi:hypothetical protein
MDPPDAGPALPVLDWPYVEGLRLDEAMHPLTLLAPGCTAGAAQPERRAAAPRGAVEVRLQGDQVDRAHPPHRDEPPTSLGAREPVRIRLLRQREPAGRSSALEPGDGAAHRRLGGWLAPLRRPIGLWCFAYATLHLSVYFGLNLLGSLEELAKEIAKHPFILFGMAAWALVLPLALTSTRASIRRLGAKRWQTLHRLIYGAAVLAAVHFILRVKGFQIEPWIYAAVAALLVLARVVKLSPLSRR